MSADVRAALAARGAPAGKLDALAAYGALLLDANRLVNLTAARSAEAVADQICDALPLVPLVTGALIDIGSGGGLPGIPLAVLCGVRVVLVEAIAKKAAFLARAIDELGLDGEALAERAEVLGREDAYRERFRHATARAVGAAPTVAELSVPFLEIGGTALLQRGALDQAERDATRDAAGMLGAELAEEIPLDGVRRILVLEKRAPTQQRFPRRAGVPEKRPLCLTGR